MGFHSKMYLILQYLYMKESLILILVKEKMGYEEVTYCKEHIITVPC